MKPGSTRPFPWCQSGQGDAGAAAVEAVKHQNTRDDKTAIELFLTGIWGWEAGLRRKLERQVRGGSLTDGVPHKRTRVVDFTNCRVRSPLCPT
jgi:hypothetical protein